MSILMEEQNRLKSLLDTCSKYQEINSHRTREEYDQWINKAKYNLEEVTVAIDAINEWRKENSGNV